MSLIDEVESIAARTDISATVKRRLIHRKKASGLQALLVNGDGALVPSFIGRTFAWNGKQFTLNAAKVINDDRLFIAITVDDGGVATAKLADIKNPPLKDSTGAHNLARLAAELFELITDV